MLILYSVQGLPKLLKPNYFTKKPFIQISYKLIGCVKIIRPLNYYITKFIE